MDKTSAICSTSCQMLLGAAEISIIRAHTASYAITFLPGGSFLLPSMMIYRAFVPILWSGKTHYKSIIYRSCFFSDNQFIVSHRSHESHKERIITLAFAIRLKTLGEVDKLRAFCDAASVRFVRSV